MKVTIEFETTDETGEISKTRNTAMMRMTDQGMQLTYVEDVSGDGRKTKCTILLSGQQLRVTRRGELTSDLLYEHGLTHHTSYSTPYGDLPVTLNTVRYLHTSNGVDYDAKTAEEDFFVQVGLHYTLAMGGDTPMEMKMKLNVKPEIPQ